MTRQRAFLLHVLISASVLALAAWVPLATWYAEGRLAFTRADRLLSIVVLVDLFAGPLLTLLIFRAGKKNLRLDLAAIALVQIAFLGIGLSALWQSRPVYLVALPHQFVLIFANDIPEPDAITSRPEAYRDLPWLGPELVGVEFPQDPEEANEVVLQASAGRDLTTFPEHYVDYQWVKGALLNAAKPMDQIDTKRIRGSIPDTWLTRTELGWVPLTSRRGDAIQVIDRTTGLPVHSFALAEPQAP